MKTSTITKMFVVFAFMLAGSRSLKAQGNLQFNQVVFYEIATLDTQYISVPAGKVWKIESTGCAQNTSPHLYLLNSSKKKIGYLASGQSIYPIWLPSGFSGAFYNSTAVYSYISITEYNVVP